MRSGVPPVFCLDIISKVKRGSTCDASWRPVLPMSAGVGRAMPLRFHTRARRASSLLASQRQRIPRTRWYSGLPTQPVKLLQSITTPFAPQRVQHVHSRLPSSRPRLTSLLTHHPGRNTPIEPSPPLGGLEASRSSHRPRRFISDASARPNPIGWQPSCVALVLEPD